MTFVVATAVTFAFTGRLLGSAAVVLTIEVLCSVWYYSLDRIWKKLKIFNKSGERFS